MIDKREISVLKDYLETNEESEPRIARSFLEDVILMFEEIQQYQGIGTVEECREARERQIAKKPDKRSDKYTDLVHHYWCPVCGRYFGQAGIHNAILFDKPKYCACGQAIDWSE